ncbi:hypothetical protein Tco_1246062 [Tanacetum coccineum]
MVSSVAKKRKEQLEEIAINNCEAECSAIIMNKVPEKPRRFRENFLSHWCLYKENSKGLEKLTLRVGKDELVYYADKSEKNKEKNFVHAISVIDFSKDDPFSGSTTTHSDDPSPSSSPSGEDYAFMKFQLRRKKFSSKIQLTVSFLISPIIPGMKIVSPLKKRLISLISDDLIPPGCRRADSEDKLMSTDMSKITENSQETRQKRTRERMSDHEAKENQASAFCSQPQLYLSKTKAQLQ